MRIHLVNADRGVAPDGSKGAAAHLRGLAEAMRGRGHVVELFSARLPAAPDGFPCRVLPLDQLPTSLVQARPEIVYERYSIGHVAALRAAQEQHIRFCLEVNAPLLYEAQRYRGHVVQRFETDAEYELFTNASLVVTVSEALRRHVAVQRGSVGGVVTVPNGFDPALFPEAARVDRPDGQVIALLGNPKPWHGGDRLPKILSALVDRGFDPQLLVVGGGAGAESIQRLAAAEGVGDRLLVTGSLDQAAATGALQQAVIGIAPYEAQEFFYFSPLKVVEYMAAGLPVVTTRQGDIGALVGDAGLVVDPRSTRALIAAVAALLSDPRRRLRMGRLGRERAFASMTWSAVVQRIERALDAAATAVA